MQHLQGSGTPVLYIGRTVLKGLFVHPLSHTCNTGHVNYSLQFMYYNTTYNIWTSTQYNIINNNRKLKANWKLNPSLHINISALKFGSEVWVLKKRDKQHLEAAQMKFLRHLLGITKLDKEKKYKY